MEWVDSPQNGCMESLLNHYHLAFNKTNCQCPVPVRTLPNHVNPAGYPLGIDRKAIRSQALDDMLDWLEPCASISCVKPLKIIQADS